MYYLKMFFQFFILLYIDNWKTNIFSISFIIKQSALSLHFKACIELKLKYLLFSFIKLGNVKETRLK